MAILFVKSFHNITRKVKKLRTISSVFHFHSYISEIMNFERMFTRTTFVLTLFRSSPGGIFQSVSHTLPDKIETGKFERNSEM